MIPWHKLSRDLQRAVLTIVILTGEAAAASSCGPQPTPHIVDPVPPPNVTRIPKMIVTEVVVVKLRPGSEPRGHPNPCDLHAGSA